MINRFSMPGILLLSMFTALQINVSANETDTLSPDKKIVYKTIDSLELSLHVFLPLNKPSHELEPSPAVVFFFGGSWKHGSPDQFYPHCRHLADKGIVAMSAEYRVKDRNGTTPAEALADAKSAMRWVRTHADELGIDSDCVIAGGGSAGGHLAAACAVVDGFNAQGDDLSISCIPDALILFNPVIDNGPDGYGYDRVEEYWREFSPIHNLDKVVPPTIFFLGTEDPLIPVETAEKFKTLMEACGNRCDLFLYEGQSHGFFNYSNPPYYEKTVEAMDHFLISLGILQHFHER